MGFPSGHDKSMKKALSGTHDPDRAFSTTNLLLFLAGNAAHQAHEHQNQADDNEQRILLDGLQ